MVVTICVQATVLVETEGFTFLWNVRLLGVGVVLFVYNHTKMMVVPHVAAHTYARAALSTVALSVHTTLPRILHAAAWRQSRQHLAWQVSLGQ